MVDNVDVKLVEYLVSNFEVKVEWDLIQKLKNDLCIMLVGQFLCKILLDELLQFLNVFLGDMSIVGLCLMMLDQVQFYFGVDYYYLCFGVIGLWQILDCNESSFVVCVIFDVEYVVGFSFKGDVLIIIKIVGVVFCCIGY